MTITTAVRRTAAKVRLLRQERAERRVEEILSVESIRTDYQRADRAGDLEVEDHFKALYQLVDTEDEKAAVSAAFAVWVRDERIEELAVGTSVDETVDLLKANNPVFIGEEQ